MTGATDLDQAAQPGPPGIVRSSDGLDARLRSVLTVAGPTCLKFSGGRTSAYMLHLLLAAHGGALPPEVIVIFNNTGKEEEATLRFIWACAERWGIDIVWLEYTAGGGFRVVDFATASRNGQPFEAVIAQRMASDASGLPNRVARYCSSEMKTRTTHRYLRSLGWTEWDSFSGIRADEPKRVHTIRSNPHPETVDETVRIPLAELGVGARDVGAFWAANDWDLELPNVGGKTMHGNCDLCFLKPSAQVVSLIAERPERAVWWAEQERKAAEAGKGTAAQFRNDRPSYAQMLDFTQQQADAFGHAAAAVEDGIECLGCTD